MTLTTAHVTIVVVVLICTATMGADGVLHAEQVSNIFIACIASLSGHGVGFAAGQKAAATEGGHGGHGGGG